MNTVSDSTIAQYLDVNAGQILASNEHDGVVSVVVNKGIDGCPKYSVPLSELETPNVSPPEDRIYDGMKVKELRYLAKEAGIKGYARMKRETLVARLSE